MQFTTKFAFLAAAVFCATTFATPLAPRDVGYEIEAREVDNDLSAREFYDMHLEARADPELSAREIEAMDVEAREYLEYLEARDAAVSSDITMMICLFKFQLNGSYLQDLAQAPAATPTSTGSSYPGSDGSTSSATPAVDSSAASSAVAPESSAAGPASAGRKRKHHHHRCHGGHRHHHRHGKGHHCHRRRHGKKGSHSRHGKRGHHGHHHPRPTETSTAGTTDAPPSSTDTAAP